VKSRICWELWNAASQIPRSRPYRPISIHWCFQQASPKLIQRFKTFNNKRNKSSYDVAGAVSDQDLEAMVNLATELNESIRAWLQNVHPDLLKG
jgi:hypothetical protein